MKVHYSDDSTFLMLADQIPTVYWNTATFYEQVGNVVHSLVVSTVYCVFIYKYLSAQLLKGKIVTCSENFTDSCQTTFNFLREFVDRKRWKICGTQTQVQVVIKHLGREKRVGLRPGANPLTLFTPKGGMTKVCWFCFKEKCLTINMLECSVIILQWGSE